MTNLQIMAQILSEATGKEPAHWERVILQALQAAGKQISDTRLGDELPGAEADRLLAQLRGDLPGVLAWVVSGAVSAHQHSKPLHRKPMHRRRVQLH